MSKRVSNIRLYLKRDLITGQPIENALVYRRVIILLAEGLAPTVPGNMATLAVYEWTKAGKPTDWLFICTGRKTTSNASRIQVMDNLTGERRYRILNEAIHLYQMLNFYGIPAEQMLLEEKSDNTPEQAEFVPEILRESCYSDPGEVFDAAPKTATLVCHDIHEPRAHAIFAEAGWSIEEVWTGRYEGDHRQPLRTLGHMWLPRGVHALAEQVQTWRSRKNKVTAAPTA